MPGVGAMIPNASDFEGYLSNFVGVLRPDDGRCNAERVRCTQLAEPEGMAGVLERFAVIHSCVDARATASQWSKYFFSRLGIGALIAQVGNDQALDLRLDRLRMTTQADGTPDVFWLGALDKSRASGPGHDLSSLIDDAFAPVIDTLSRHCRLSRRVFWSNAGVYIAWALGELESQQRIPDARLVGVRALLSRRNRPDGGFNPFHRVYKHCPPGTLDGDDAPADHCRRLCCMRDLDPQWALCANCPRAMHYATRANDHA